MFKYEIKNNLNDYDTLIEFISKNEQIVDNLK